MSIVAPSLQPDRWRADSAVQEVALSMNAAQRLAVMRQHDIVVTFDLTARRVHILEDPDNSGSAVERKVIDLPETIGFGRGAAPALSQGPGPVSFRDTGDGPTVTFHRNGSASETGIAYLNPFRGSQAGGAEGVRALTVQRATGEVRCFSYRSGSWKPTC
jgi:hypothetical protein